MCSVNFLFWGVNVFGFNIEGEGGGRVEREVEMFFVFFGFLEVSFVLFVLDFLSLR